MHFNPEIKRLELGCGVVKVVSFALRVCVGTHLKSDPGCERSPVISERAKLGGERKKGKVSEAVSFKSETGEEEVGGGVKS